MSSLSPNLQSCFASAKTQKKALETVADTNSPAFREQLSNAISAFEQCQKLIQQLSLFSPNESVEDVTTGDLQFLTVPYLLAELLQRSYGVDRLKTLQQTRDEYERYLEALEQYGLLSPSNKKLYEQYLEQPDSFSLTPTNDVSARRQVKITRFKEEKELKQKLEYLSQNKDSGHNDEDIVRQVYLAEIDFYTHQTFQSLDMLSQELSMLKVAPSLPPVQRADERKPGLSNGKEMGYSDRLDMVGSQMGLGRYSGVLLSPDGKPLQPFTLTSRRTDIKRGVFRPGHNLPTMSIDEYLEEERRRGGIIEGGGEKSGIPKEIDEDDFEKADEETLKARAWDEFTEANPRGSGNTLNRG
ncbi:Type 2A phosphatase-associated protein 42 [Microsporum audouinii]